MFDVPGMHVVSAERTDAALVLTVESGADVVLHARLLDVVPGRSGTAYAGWLKA